MLYGESSPLLGGNYLLGDSCSFRDSGGGWQTVNSTRFLSFGVAKFGPNIIACGAKGGIGQWNSSLSFWNVFPGYQGTNDLLAISADSSGAFWIVGRNGTVLCIDNNLISISIVTFPYKVDLYSVACLSDTEGWVVGGQGTIARYTAGRVLSQASGAMTLSVSWAIESQSVFPTLLSIYIAGADLLFAVGKGGASVTSDGGGAWTALPSPVRSDLHGVGGAGSVVVACGDNGTLLTLDTGAALAWSPVPSAGTANLTAVSYGRWPIVAVGARGAMLINYGSGFSAATLPGGCPARAVAVGPACADGVSEVPRAGSDGVSPALLLSGALSESAWRTYSLYCDGGGWRDLRVYSAAVAFRIRAAAAVSPGQGMLLQLGCGCASPLVSVADYTAGGVLDATWRAVSVPLAALAPAACDLSAVSTLIFTGFADDFLIEAVALTPTPLGAPRSPLQTPLDAPPASPTSADLRAVAAGGVGAVFACGDAGTVLRIWRSAAPAWAWALEPAPTTADLLGIAVLPTEEAFAVGRGGVLLQRSPATGMWQLGEGAAAAAAGADLYGVAASSATAAWAVGGGGLILSFDGTGWTVQVRDQRYGTREEAVELLAVCLVLNFRIFHHARPGRSRCVCACG